MVSTARAGAVSVVDKAGRDLMRLLDRRDWPAIYEGKQLVWPSTCDIHPKYQALRPPALEESRLQLRGNLFTEERD